jgi:D-3-phosphoglycerate dehydrogenase
VTVARYGVGLDNIDVDAASNLGIVVSNVPDYCIDEVSDHALALMLALRRRLVEFAAQTRGGGWNNQEFGTPHRMRGQTLGLVGYGRIARLVAKKAAAFGMSVTAYTPRLGVDDADEVRPAGSLEDLLRQSDIVSLHAPLTPSTRHMIGSSELAQMRPEAILVNTARGALVDEEALYSALVNGALGGAGLDVMDEEPPPPDHPLRRAPRVLMTPHAAFYSTESVHDLQEKAATNVANMLSGVIPTNTVNRAVLDLAGLRVQVRR